ncbi:NUDIX domain-containing protein [Deinococcus sp. HMF7604]|uniref:NUDIX domain-containing protein n=1 Tax=Deinococcus betulae TaxID=2873312 RepID=UPI001CC9E6BB|nr:NUDIX domain-containing protein [Deinococcus betulae]MBZ9751199.1 NUDIX domain-containing protein [Deinococcus betulae]
MPDYIAELRAQIGQRPVNLMGACGLIRDEQGHLLLQRLAGQEVWALPGGLCELGEPPLETLRREVWEETALTVQAASLLDLLTTPLRTVANGDQAHFYTAMYRVDAWTGVPVPDGVEGAELAFFAPTALPTLRGQPGEFARVWLAGL